LGDWTPEAAEAIALCSQWAREVRADIPCDIYLFGSAIYQDGDQFDAQLSDLDIVVKFHRDLEATERAERIVALRTHKIMLELRMVPCLHRTNCADPGVSVLPITSLELLANVHKGKSRHFFTKNIFLDLLTDVETISIPTAGTSSLSDEARQALEFAQEVRNQFLAVSANSTGGLAPFDGPDPLPKALARTAAQLVPEVEAGSWYDTRYGLEFLWDELSRRRSESPELRQLHRKISIRRGGRGHRQQLSDFDQLLLAEILYDRATAAPVVPLVTWEIRFRGASPSLSERDRLVEELRSLVPDAEILGVFDGSIIIRLRSSKRSFLTMRRLEELQALPKFFTVADVDLLDLENGERIAGFSTHGVIDRIAERISEWRPQSRDRAVESEASLARWLSDWLSEDDQLSTAKLVREALIGEFERPLRADILLQFAQPGGQQRVVIELVRVRHRRDFFSQLGRAQGLGVPTILVLVGEPDKLSSLEPDIRALSALDVNIRVVSVVLDNG
jgi:predicted nucleotidyltransferase